MASLEQAAFNLISQPWLPIRRKNGSLTYAGLHEALLNAHDFSRLEDPSPLVQSGLHRLLLAVLHRALAGPKDAAEAQVLLRGGRFPAEAVKGYLERHRARFDLFDEDAPFYQVADFDLPVTKLAPVTR